MKRIEGQVRATTFLEDVLDITVSEVCEFFDAQPNIVRMFRTFHNVGLDHIRIVVLSVFAAPGEYGGCERCVSALLSVRECGLRRLSRR